MRCLPVASSRSKQLDRKKLLADPIMIFAIILVMAFLLLFVVYPLCTILTQSFQTDYPNSLTSNGQKLTSLVKQDPALADSVFYQLGDDCVNFANEYRRGEGKRD